MNIRIKVRTIYTDAQGRQSTGWLNDPDAPTFTTMKEARAYAKANYENPTMDVRFVKLTGRKAA